MVVDFPEPLGPKNPVTIPGCTTKLKPSTASLVPYRLLRFSTSIIDVALQAFGGVVFPASCIRKPEVLSRFSRSGLAFGCSSGPPSASGHRRRGDGGMT